MMMTIESTENILTNQLRIWHYHGPLGLGVYFWMCTQLDSHVRAPPVIVTDITGVLTLNPAL